MAKMRCGFVSNSSSCSFVLGKYFMTEEQIRELSNFIDFLYDYVEYPDDVVRDNPEYLNYIDLNSTFSGADILSESTHYFMGRIDQSLTSTLTNFLDNIGVDRYYYTFDD